MKGKFEKASTCIDNVWGLKLVPEVANLSPLDHLVSYLY